MSKMSAPSVALVTCRNIPELDPDEDLLLQSLRKAGMRAELLAWDDPGADPSRFNLCVLRSCWNYYEDPDVFLKWIAGTAAASRLMNAEDIVRWNLHKRYLRALEESGIAIIPTVWFEKGERIDLHRILREKDWNDIVIKPSISASSYRTGRFGLTQLTEAQSFLEALLAERDAMVQCYMPTVERLGERATVYIDGELTHAVAKSPRFAGGVERVSDAREVSRKERAFAERALTRVDGPLLYARVDTVIQDDGTLLLSELELMEPSLFLLQSPVALERFVAAIKRLCLVAECG
jgi:hypothetical protein